MNDELIWVICFEARKSIGLPLYSINSLQILAIFEAELP
jgi:hypothetical protein